MKKVSKKISMIVTTVILALGVLSGCGSKEEKTPEIVGTWKAASVEVSGVSVDFDQYAEQLGSDADSIKMAIDVKEDKTFTMDMMDQKAEGTWVQKDENYILTVDGQDQEVTITDGELVFEEKTTNMKVTFKKNK